MTAWWPPRPWRAVQQWLETPAMAPRAIARATADRSRCTPWQGCTPRAYQKMKVPPARSVPPISATTPSSNVTVGTRRQDLTGTDAFWVEIKNGDVYRVKGDTKMEAIFTHKNMNSLPSCSRLKIVMLFAPVLLAGSWTASAALPSGYGRQVPRARSLKS